MTETTAAKQPGAFPRAVRHMWHNYANFRGTTGRRDFWLYTGPYFLLYLLAYAGSARLAIFVAGTYTPGIEEGGWRVALAGVNLLSWILSTALVVCGIPVVSGAVRRRRDTGRGWRVLLWGAAIPLLPLLGALLLLGFGTAANSLLAALLSLLLATLVPIAIGVAIVIGLVVALSHPGVVRPTEEQVAQS